MHCFADKNISYNNNENIDTFEFRQQYNTIQYDMIVKFTYNSIIQVGTSKKNVSGNIYGIHPRINSAKINSHKSHYTLHHHYIQFIHFIIITLTVYKLQRIHSKRFQKHSLWYIDILLAQNS